MPAPRPQLTDLQPGDEIGHRRQLLTVLELTHWTALPDSGVRHVLAIDHDGERRSLTAYELNTHGWQLVRRAPAAPDHVPTPVSAPRAVLAEIERVLARQDREAAALARQDHYRLCTRGCPRCRPHR